MKSTYFPEEHIKVC